MNKLPYTTQVLEHNKRFSAEKGYAPKYIIQTYGCQMNEHDSETLSGMLEAMGYKKTNAENDADLILLPGGMPGAATLEKCDDLRRLILRFAE